MRVAIFEQGNQFIDFRDNGTDYSVEKCYINAKGWTSTTYIHQYKTFNNAEKAFKRLVAKAKKGI